MRFFLFIFIIIAVVIFNARDVYAQNCDMVPEMIVKLRQPQLGSFNIWDHSSGLQDAQDSYKTAVIMPDTGQTVLAGQRVKKGQPSKSVFLQELDRRGRAIWIKDVSVDGAEDVVKLLWWRNELVLYVNRTLKGDDAIWVGFFDREGTLKREAFIKDPKFDFALMDVIAAHEEDRMLLSVQASAKSAGGSDFTILYWVDRQGKVRRDRAFMLGLENTIHSIARAEGGRYFMSGSIETADGRMAGWLANLEKDGALRWQRQYARGVSAKFKDMAMYNRGQYVALVGDALPADAERFPSGWVMVANATDGEPAWQRYYREDGAVYGQTIFTNDDGQIQIMMSLEDMEDEAVHDYVRLVSLNPRGVILSSHSYQNGIGARAAGMVRGNKGEAVIFGTSDIVYTKEQDGDAQMEDKDIHTHDLWVVAAPPNDRYTDPCKQPFRFLP